MRTGNFMWVFRIICILVTGYITQSCVSVKNSNQSRNETVELAVEEKQDLIKYDDLEQQEQRTRGAIAGIILGKGLPFAIKGVKKLINADMARYTAEYKAGLNHLYFYDRISKEGPLDPVGFQFNGFKLLRTVENKKTQQQDTAVYLSLRTDVSDPLDMINNSLFRLEVEDIVINLAKAKVPDKRWYFPWTWIQKGDKKFHMDLEVAVTATWMTNDGVMYKDQEIGMFILNLRDIPLDQGSPEYRRYFEELKGQPLEGYCLFVPRSVVYYSRGNGVLEKGYGKGLFNVKVSIIESGVPKFESTEVDRLGGD